MFQCANCYNLFFPLICIYQMYQVHSWYIYGLQGRGAWKIGLGKEVIVNKWLKKSLTCTFMIHPGIWFSSANFVGNIYLNTWYFEKKKNILKCAYLLLRKWKNWSLSFKKTLVSPFSLLKYKDTSHFFFQSRF